MPIGLAQRDPPPAPPQLKLQLQQEEEAQVQQQQQREQEQRDTDQKIESLKETMAEMDQRITSQQALVRPLTAYCRTAPTRMCYGSLTMSNPALRGFSLGLDHRPGSMRVWLTGIPIKDGTVGFFLGACFHLTLAVYK